MRKQVGVVFCPTSKIRTLAIFDQVSREWVWVETFKTKEKS